MTPGGVPVVSTTRGSGEDPLSPVGWNVGSSWIGLKHIGLNMDLRNLEPGRPPLCRCSCAPVVFVVWQAALCGGTGGPQPSVIAMKFQRLNLKGNEKFELLSCCCDPLHKK